MPILLRTPSGDWKNAEPSPWSGCCSERLPRETHFSNRQVSIYPNAHTRDIHLRTATLQAWKSGESEFHAIHFQARTRSAPATDLDVFVAIDIEHHKQFLSDLRRNLAIYAAIATLISGLLGWLAAHQGMAPLRAMKTRAATVTGQRLEGRMPVESVPVEMADLARELNHMLDRLQEDFQRLSDFSSDLAHELRTPISNLLTQTQVTLSAKRDTETYRDTLASNAEELQRLGRMVSDAVLAKTERGVDLPNKGGFPLLLRCKHCLSSAKR